MPIYHNLKRNPFVERLDHPLVGDSRRVLIRNVVDAIERSIRDSSQIIGSLIGTYGEGKTFTLYRLNEILNNSDRFAEWSSETNKRSVISAVITAAEAKLPTAYLPYLYSSFARSLGPSFFQTLIGRLQNSGVSFASLTPIANRNFVAALESLASEERSSLALQWLSGYPLSKGERERIGVMLNITYEDFARDCFVSLLSVSKQAGYDCICVLVDEVEYLFHAGPKPVIPCLTSIKHLYDSVGKVLSSDGDQFIPLVLVLCLVPRTWQEMSEVVEQEEEKGRSGLTALIRRIKEETRFRLQRFSLDDTRQLISLLLEGARQAASAQGGDISPFDEDTIKLIHNRANGVPGYIIDQCRRVLEEADRQQEDITQAKAALWLGLTVEEITIGEEVVEEAEVIDEEL